jgi:NAD(P)-dependent dehydrogenase (short-subunit alcohol dehydrogenase family)
MKRGSVIINTGSITGLEGADTLLDYAATKGAVHAFTKSLAQNLVEKGIRVNCVAPGPVWTPLNTAAKPPEEVTKFGEDTPNGPSGSAGGDCADLTSSSLGADSSFITGEIIHLARRKRDGGLITAAVSPHL